MIVGIGVDVAEISRLEVALQRTPALASRLFAESERGLPVRSLAGCFAAKEAVAKALGGTARTAVDRRGHQPRCPRQAAARSQR